MSIIFDPREVVELHYSYLTIITHLVDLVKKYSQEPIELEIPDYGSEGLGDPEDLIDILDDQALDTLYVTPQEI